MHKAYEWLLEEELISGFKGEGEVCAYHFSELQLPYSEEVS